MADSYARLPIYLIARAEGDPKGWPKRAQFLTWYRDVKGYHGSVEHAWADLRSGRPVPHQIAAGFAEYLKEKRGYDFAPVMAGNADADGVWKDLRTVVHFATEQYTDNESMYFRHRYKDPEAAAEMTVACVGRKVGAEAGEEMTVGEREIGIGTDQLARWISAMWRADFRSVMFAVSKGVRVGFSAFLPLTERAFLAVCAGELGCWEISADDLESPSRYVFFVILAEPPQVANVKKATRAQVRTTFYQAAYATRGIERPVFLAPATNPQYAERLRRHGYHDIGGRLKGAQKPLVVMRHPSEIDGATSRDWHSYRLLMFMIRMYQTANSRQWKKEDRLSE